jgi:hypothetical protein
VSGAGERRRAEGKRSRGNKATQEDRRQRRGGKGDPSEDADANAKLPSHCISSEGTHMRRGHVSPEITLPARPVPARKEPAQQNKLRTVSSSLDFLFNMNKRHTHPGGIRCNAHLRYPNPAPSFEHKEGPHRARYIRVGQPEHDAPAQVDAELAPRRS